jgi:hypothetical protein
MAKWSRDEAKVLNGRKRGDFGRKGRGRGRRREGATSRFGVGFGREVLTGLPADEIAHGSSQG